MKRFLALICSIIMGIFLVSCTVFKEDNSEEFVIIDITIDNYTDYIDFVATDTAIDIDGNPIEHTCVIVTSKVYEDGLYFISAEDSKWGVQYVREDGQNSGMGVIGDSPFGTVLEDISDPASIKVTNIQGKYKFVKSEYVEEYVFENGVRKVTLKDDRYQEIVFEGISAVDFSYPY